jgi:hypothetical protein
MELKTFTFGKGSHESRKDGMCVMEAVAMLAGEQHSDSPECADPVISKLAIWLYDSCADQLRQELLLDLPWRIVGTKSTPEIEQQRAYIAADWAVRTVCPILLRKAGLEEQAASLESLPMVSDQESARAAVVAAGAAWAAAWAAKAAARAARASAEASWAAEADGAARAARAAAGAAKAAAEAAEAAEAAAEADWAAEADGAAGAAWAAAGAAGAAGAAWAAKADGAAGAAAGADLEFIQRSCLELLDRMIRLTEPREQAIHATSLEQAHA